VGYRKEKGITRVHPDHGDKKILIKVYDPPMCCSSGVCGTNVNSSLVEFSGALKSLLKQGIAVERWNLSQQPQDHAILYKLF